MLVIFAAVGCYETLSSWGWELAPRNQSHYELFLLCTAAAQGECYNYTFHVMLSSDYGLLPEKISFHLVVLNDRFAHV